MTTTVPRHQFGEIEVGQRVAANGYTFRVMAIAGPKVTLRVIHA